MTRMRRWATGFTGLIYNLPASTESLDENIDPDLTELESGALQGSNSWEEQATAAPAPRAALTATFSGCMRWIVSLK